jgi:SSS family solute:Na+ symporter
VNAVLALPASLSLAVPADVPDASGHRSIAGGALVVVILLFLVVAAIGFLASRWRTSPEQRGLHSLDEWGLGGRGFGSWVTWFLLGGDLYTAYTFVAVPAAMWATGAVSGFFAVPYTIVLYPIVFILMSRLWSVSRSHGYVTPADFVGGRYGGKVLSTAIAVTGIVATMPYIALQLVGMRAVLTVLGLGSGSNSFVNDLPLVIAFVVLAAYTYTGGLRAPALIAVVKDLLIYLAIVVAVIYLPSKFGGWGSIFDAADTKLSTTNPATHKPAGAVIPGMTSFNAYWTLALGSAMALFMYPHSITGVLATKSRNTIRRNAVVLPLYSLMLGFLALLGYVAIKAGTVPLDTNGKINAQLVVPQLFLDNFPAWFAGIALAAIAIGALVPAAIMSIAASNLFTRNIYRDLIKPDVTPRTQAKVSKLVSLLVKVGALVFVLGMDQSSAINLQLLAVVQQVGPARRLGRGDGLRDDRRVQRGQPGDREPLRRLDRRDPVDAHDRLHRGHGLRPERGRRGPRDARPARAQGPRHRGQHAFDGLRGRRGRLPRPARAGGAPHRALLSAPASARAHVPPTRLPNTGSAPVRGHGRAQTPCSAGGDRVLAK